MIVKLKEFVLYKFNVKRKNKKTKLEFDDREKTYFDFLVIYILLLGLANFPNTSKIITYYFGFVFFAAGFYISMLHESGAGIFLFIHRLTGLLLVVIGEIGSIFSSPIMSDNPTKIYIYLLIMTVLFVLDFLYNILFIYTNTYYTKKIY